MTETTPLFTAGDVEFDGTQAMLLRPDLSKRVRRRKMSPSTMNALTDNSACYGRFAIDSLMPRVPDPFSPAELGTSAHQVLEDLLALPGDERTADAALGLLEQQLERTFPVDDTDPGNEAVRQRWRTEVLKAYEGIFDIEDVTKVDVFAREGRIGATKPVELEGVPITGFIDRIDRTASGGLRPIDYKTGKVSDKRFGDPHGDQLRLYAMAVEAEYGIKPTSARVYYTKFGKVGKVSLAKPQMDQVRKKIVDSWEGMTAACDSDAFTLTTSPLCGWCPLVSVCPAAAAEGKTAKVEVPGPVELGIDIPVRSSLSTGGDTPPKEEKTMGQWREAKPWTSEVKGRLNPNAYAAQAVFGLATRALADIAGYNKQIAGDPVDPVPLTRSTVEALAQTYARILENAEEKLSDGQDWESGLNTRLRGMLFSAIEVHGIPFGSTTEEWDAWVEKITGNLVLLAGIGEGIYDTPIEDPWLALASDGDDYTEED